MRDDARILGEWPLAWLSRIEDASLNASAPPQQRWLDGWLLRLNPGKAQRARSINAVAHGLLPLQERLALCQAEFAAASLPAIFRITPFSKPQGLDAWLAQQGWRKADDSLVMACPELPAGPFELPEGMRLASADHAAYAELVGAFRGSPATERTAHAQRLQASPVPYHGVVVYSAQGEPVACAQLTVESGLAGLYDVHTAPPWRGRGLAYSLCGHLLAQARSAGASTGYLQVDALNTTAQAVYRRLSFADGYTYHYRRAP